MIRNRKPSFASYYLTVYFLSFARIHALNAVIFLPLQDLAAALNFDFCAVLAMILIHLVTIKD